MAGRPTAHDRMGETLGAKGRRGQRRSNRRRVSMAVPLATYDPRPVGGGAPIREVAPLLGHPDLPVFIVELFEVVFVDEVLGPNLLRAELPSTYPAADGFGILPDLPGGFGHGQHRSCILLHAAAPSEGGRPTPARGARSMWPS